MLDEWVPLLEAIATATTLADFQTKLTRALLVALEQEHQAIALQQTDPPDKGIQYRLSTLESLILRVQTIAAQHP